MHEKPTRGTEAPSKRNGSLPIATISRIGQPERVLATIVAVPKENDASNGHSPSLEYPGDRRRASSHVGAGRV